VSRGEDIGRHLGRAEAYLALAQVPQGDRGRYLREVRAHLRAADEAVEAALIEAEREAGDGHDGEGSNA